MTTQKTAKLRVCASCEWIFKTNGDPSCPQCNFGSYGARFVYGDKAYRFAKTQKPWFDKKLADYSIKLRMQINQSPISTSKSLFAKLETPTERPGLGNDLT